MRKRVSGKLLWQYFLSYFAVMALVMTILLTYTYSSFYRFHGQMLLQEYQGKLELVREMNENLLTRLVSLPGQMTSSSELSPFDFARDSARAPAAIRQLNTYKASIDGLCGLFLVFQGTDYVLSHTSTYQLKNFATDAIGFSEITQERFLALLQNTQQFRVLPSQRVTGYTLVTQGRSDIAVPIFAPLTTSGIRCGTVLFLVENAQYERWFRSIAGERADVYILSGSTPIASRQISGLPMEALLDARAQGARELRWQGEKYHMLLLAGQSFAQSYLLLLSDWELAVAMSTSVQLMLVVAAVAAAVGLLLITRMVQSRVKPIRLVYSMLSDREPSGNELVEIRDAVQQRIDENTAMSNRMEGMADLRRSEFVRRFLMGLFAGEDDYLSLAEEIHLNVDYPCYVVGIVAKPEHTDYELTPDKLERLLDAPMSCVCRPLGMHDRLAFLAFGESEDTLIAFLEQKLAGMRACCGGITMAISASHVGWRRDNAPIWKRRMPLKCALSQAMLRRFSLRACRRKRFTASATTSRRWNGCEPPCARVTLRGSAERCGRLQKPCAA